MAGMRVIGQVAIENIRALQTYPAIWKTFLWISVIGSKSTFREREPISHEY